MELAGATLVKDDARLHYRIYRFSPSLQPGESRTLTFTAQSHNRGFENSLSNNEVMQNGTFFKSTVGPVIGYDPGRELTDPNDRRKFGLGEQELMPFLEATCADDCRDNYLLGHSDWVGIETVIGTSADQTAIAPGSLVREWREGGRHYFQYQLDHPLLYFCSFMSARYEVLRKRASSSSRAWRVLPRPLRAPCPTRSRSGSSPISMILMTLIWCFTWWPTKWAINGGRTRWSEPTCKAQRSSPNPWRSTRP